MLLLLSTSLYIKQYKEIANGSAFGDVVPLSWSGHKWTTKDIAKPLALVAIQLKW